MELDPVQVEAHLLGAGAAVPLHAVGVEAALAGAGRAGLLPADAVLLVAGAARAGATVHRGPLVVDALDVLHDVDLADARPVPPVAAVLVAEHPERGPVALGRGAGDVRHLDPGLDLQLAAHGRLEVLPVGLDTARGPVPGGVPDGGDLQVPGAVQRHVGGAGGHRLDLAGAEAAGPPGVAGAGGVAPVGGVDAAAGRAVEVVAEDLGPAGRGGDGGVGVLHRAGHCDREQRGGGEGGEHGSDAVRSGPCA